MGVFHLMGLGRSPGVVVAPLSYLDYRHANKQNEDDHLFFSGSGSSRKSDKEEKEESNGPGKVEGIVLFSTREIISGKNANGEAFNSYPYIDNEPGRLQGANCDGIAMQKVIHKALESDHFEKIFEKKSGKKKEIPVFWCEIGRYSVEETNERIMQVIAALSSGGSRGKEMWINMTGGTNPINFSLQLSALLSSCGARFYYVQAQSDQALKCLYFTSEKNYWLELPILPLGLDQLSWKVLDLLNEGDKLEDELLTEVRQQGLPEMSRYDRKSFLDDVLQPMQKRRLIECEEKVIYSIGKQGKVIMPYLNRWEQVTAKKMSIETLTQERSWITRTFLKLS